jgi:hypothetical protein
MSKFLSPKDVENLTGRPRPSDQLKWLRLNGIEARRKGNGEVVVLWSAVEAILGGGSAKKPKISGPNWGAMNPKAA